MYWASSKLKRQRWISGGRLGRMLKSSASKCMSWDTRCSCYAAVRRVLRMETELSERRERAYEHIGNEKGILLITPDLMTDFFFPTEPFPSSLMQFIWDFPLQDSYDKHLLPTSHQTQAEVPEEGNKPKPKPLLWISLLIVSLGLFRSSILCSCYVFIWLS